MRALLVTAVTLVAACAPCDGVPTAPQPPQVEVVSPTAAALQESTTGELRDLCREFPTTACLPFGERLRNAEGDAPAAREAFRFGCDAGAGDSCVARGRMSRTGHGGERSDSDALEWYRAGCAHGDPIGCNNAGILLRDGLGTEADETEALRLFRSACQAGYWVACDAYGGIIMSHGLDHPDADDARAELDRACVDGNEVLACVTRAEWARDLELNDAVARTLFSRACNLDDVPACVEFARFAHAGRGGEQDRPTGRQLLDLGCRRGILDACVDLAEIYEEGVGVEPDLARAEAFRRHACEAGWQEACPREEGSGDDPQP